MCYRNVLGFLQKRNVKTPVVFMNISQGTLQMTWICLNWLHIRNLDSLYLTSYLVQFTICS